MVQFRFLLFALLFVLKCVRGDFTACAEGESSGFISKIAVGWPDAISIKQKTAGHAFDDGTCDLHVTINPPSQTLRDYYERMMIPLFGSGVNVYANILGNYDSLVLDLETIARIYSGKLTKWNDPLIQALNPFTTLPNVAIAPYMPENCQLFEVFSGLFNEVLGETFVLDESFVNRSIDDITQFEAAVIRYPYSMALMVSKAQTKSLLLVSLMNNKRDAVLPTVSTISTAFIENWERYEDPFTFLEQTALTSSGYPLVVIHYGLIKREFELGAWRKCEDIDNLGNFIAEILTDNDGRDVLRGIDCVPHSSSYSENFVSQIWSDLTCNDELLKSFEAYHAVEISGPSNSIISFMAFSFHNTVFSRSDFQLDLNYTMCDSMDGIVESVMDSEIDGGIIVRSNIEHHVRDPNFIYAPLGRIMMQYVANLPGMSLLDTLKLDADVMELLARGCIGYWDDERITRDNPSISFPNLKVTIFAIDEVVGINILPGGEVCNNELKADVISVSYPFDESKLCETPGSLGISLIAAGTGTSGRLSQMCDSGTSVNVGVLVQKSIDGSLVYPRYEFIEDCEVNSDSWGVAVNQKNCWPIFAEIDAIYRREFIQPEDVLQPSNFLYSGVTQLVTGCDLMNYYAMSAYNFFNEGSSIGNIALIGLHTVGAKSMAQAATDILTMTCNGNPIVENDNSDTLEWIIRIGGGLFLVLGIIALIIIMSLTLRNRRQKISEGNLKRALERDRIRLNEATRMTAWINHEIRNILNGVLGLSLFARDTLKEATTQTSIRQTQELIAHSIKDINTVVQSCELMAILTTDVMKLRQLEEGKLSSVKTPTNVCKLVNTVMKVFRPKFNEKPAITIKINLFNNAESEELVLDAVHCMQVLVNYVGNAIKFTEKGTIRIVVKKLMGTNRLRFEVHDTGYGIPNELQKSIFQQRWIQADTKERAQGSGFGLFLCFGLVTKVMKGTIGFESILRLGSTFWFEVPIGGDDLNDRSTTTSFIGIDSGGDSSMNDEDEDDAIKAIKETFKRDKHGKLRHKNHSAAQPLPRKGLETSPAVQMSNRKKLRRSSRPNLSVDSPRIYRRKKNHSQTNICRTSADEDIEDSETSSSSRHHTLQAGQSRACAVSILQFGDAGVSHHHHDNVQHQNHHHSPKKHKHKEHSSRKVLSSHSTSESSRGFDTQHCVSEDFDSSIVMHSGNNTPFNRRQHRRIVPSGPTPIKLPNLRHMKKFMNSSGDSVGSGSVIVMNPKRKLRSRTDSNNSSGIESYSSSEMGTPVFLREDTRVQESLTEMFSGSYDANERPDEDMARRGGRVLSFNGNGQDTPNGIPKSGLLLRFLAKRNPGREGEPDERNRTGSYSLPGRKRDTARAASLPPLGRFSDGDAIEAIRAMSKSRRLSVPDSNLAGYKFQHDRAPLALTNSTLPKSTGSPKTETPKRPIAAIQLPDTLSIPNKLPSLPISTSTSFTNGNGKLGTSSSKKVSSTLDDSMSPLLRNSTQHPQKVVFKPMTPSSETVRKEKCLYNYKILVVDDSPVNRLILRRSLSRAGAEVIEAGDGQAAISLWKATDQIDLIWMDVVMPILNGLEATKQLRKLGCKVAIIACTGNVQEQDHRLCIEAGMTRLEGKPLNPNRAVKVSQSFIPFDHTMKRSKHKSKTKQ